MSDEDLSSFDSDEDQQSGDSEDLSSEIEIPHFEVVIRDIELDPFTKQMQQSGYLWNLK